ncbi:condensation domain-containing protein [Actinoplanes sp. NPDC049265]|uniref:condensation domain-containing protein n=1 Tax=Actinoplanes sp. NPDC049265 TaxID=3363902 RepID=UPI00371665D0
MTEARGTASIAETGASGGVTAALAEVWRTVLEVGEVDDDSNFFELGGHSMLAALLIAQCEKCLGTIIPLQLIFDHPVFRDFVTAALRYDERGPSLPKLVPQGLSRGPLSLQQQEYLRLEQALGLPVNNMVAVVKVGAPLALETLQAALDDLVRRHPALRTVFRGEPAGSEQVVLPIADLAPLSCTETDLSGLDSRRRTALLRSRVMRDHLLPFDLVTGPLVRCRIFRNGDEPDVLVLHLHHAAADGNCVGFLLDDLAAACAGRPLGSPRPDEPSHLDYCRWQRDHHEQMIDESGDHWRGVVRDLAENLAEPAMSGSALSASYVRFSVQLPITETHRLRTWAAAEGLTEFSSVAAAAAVAVGRLHRRERAGIGIMLDNRHADMEHTVGSFALSSLMSVDVSGAPTPRDIIGRTQDSRLAARRWTHLPLESLLAEPTDELGVTPADLVDVVVDFERIYRMNRPGRLPLNVDIDLSELLRVPLLGPRRTLTALVQADGRMSLTIECVDDPREREDAGALLDATRDVLTRFANAPEEPIRPGA